MPEPIHPVQVPSRPPSRPPTPPPRGGSPWPWLLGLLLVTLAAWGPASIPTTVGPSYDDREAVVGNPVVDGSLPARSAFQRDYWHHIEDAGHYRPLAALLLRWDRSASPEGRGTEPDWIRFRRTNVVLHALIVLLAGAALIRLDRSHGLPLPWLGLGLFALHPAAADVVAWISGRTSLVSAMGAAIGLLGAASLSPTSRGRGLRGAAVAFAACLIALLGKEDGVVLIPLLPLLLARCSGRRAAIGGVLGGAAALLAVAALRQHALGSPIPSSPTAPLAALPLLERLPLGLAAWWSGACEFLSPWRAWPPSIHLADLEARPGPWLRAAALLAAGFAAAVTLAVRGSARTGPAGAAACAGLVSLGAVALALLPLVQIVPAGELFAPRFLYQPMLLGCYASSALLEAGLCRLPSTWLRAAARLAILGVCVASIPDAASTYDSRASFWRAHLPAHEEDPRVWNDLGNAARESGDLLAARAAFEHAIELDPDYSRPRTNLGTLALSEGDLLEAELQLRAAVAAGPNNPVARANLGNVLLRAGAHEEAAAEYRRAVGLAPGRGAFHRGLGRSLLESGDSAGACAALEQALALDPGDDRARAALEQARSRR
ncbi:MAG: tetratricopeptide repeat protein [Planctomycetota bacterium]|nr:tetratricopeptide repeat protein [Planctomycetota bacterium]